MKIAVSAQGMSSTDPVDDRFGRCPWFVVHDTEVGSYAGVSNPGAAAGGGAGVRAAAALDGEGVEVVLTGHLGPKASSGLKSAGIAAVTGVSGTVEAAVAEYLGGRHAATEGPTVDSHPGMR